MRDRIDEKRISDADQALIRQREADQINQLTGQSQQAASTRVKDTAKAQDAAQVRRDNTRVADSNQRDTQRAGKTGKSPESPTKFKVADGRDLQNLMAGRPKPVARPPEATLRRADVGTLQQARQPRPATEISRPSGATRLAEGRAIQGRREAAIAERPRNDQLPREQAHLRAGTPKASSLQRLQLAAKIRAYVTNLFKPKGPSTPEGTNARQLQASVSQKKPPTSDPKANLLASKGTTGQPTTGASASLTKGSAHATKEAGTPEGSGQLFALGDGTDAETQACVADNRDAFYRLVEPNASPLSFNPDAWQEVQKERSNSPHLRNTSTEPTHDHRRVEARRGRGDRLTG